VTVRGNWDTSIARQASHGSPSGQWTRAISVARELGMPDADAYARALLDGIYRGQKAD
jgi:hypothetical protein